MQFEKILRTVRKGIKSIEELEKVEKKETERKAIRNNYLFSAISFSFDTNLT